MDYILIFWYSDYNMYYILAGDYHIASHWESFNSEDTIGFPNEGGKEYWTCSLSLAFSLKPIQWPEIVPKTNLEIEKLQQTSLEDDFDRTP